MPKKILIAEDDVVLRSLLANKLRRIGYDVSEVDDGEAALARLHKDIPDVLLLDILMPIKNGMEVLEEMRRDPMLANVPVIIVSNSGQPFEIDRARALGVKEFLIKATFDPKEVVAKVETILGVSSAAGSGAVPADAPVIGPSVAPIPPRATQAAASKIIFVIEDEQMLSDLLCAKLRVAGFDVVGAISGKEAMEILGGPHMPDLVVLDLLLPDMNGFEILSAMRKDARHSSTPVMILSNLDQEKDIERAKTFGVTEFLIKAKYSLPEIVERVTRMVQ